MKKETTPRSLLILLGVGLSCACPATPMHAAEITPEEASQRYMQNFREYLESRLQNASDTAARAERYHRSYAEYLHVLRHGILPPPASETLPAEATASSTIPAASVVEEHTPPVATPSPVLVEPVATTGIPTPGVEIATAGAPVVPGFPPAPASEAVTDLDLPAAPASATQEASPSAPILADPFSETVMAPVEPPPTASEPDSVIPAVVSTPLEPLPEPIPPSVLPVDPPAASPPASLPTDIATPTVP